MRYNDTDYAFVKNPLGDVIAIIQNGKVVAKYEYDAWGNHKVFNPNGTENTSTSFIGNINPIRYRGYYYDVESGLYYLQTRYYDPTIGQFISLDSPRYLDPEDISGLDLYAYANYNPIKNKHIVVANKWKESSDTITWLDLSLLGVGFSWIENGFSIFAGAVDGYRKIKGLNEFAGLETASNWLMVIGIALNVGLSIYDNLTIPDLSGIQRAGNIAGDCLYIGLSAFLTWGVSALVAMIPGVGPFIAPLVGLAVGFIFDALWYGDWWKPNGKSIDAWVKEFFTWMFGGFK